MLDALSEYLAVRTANETGLTVEQVKTINNLEHEHRAAEAAQDRLIQAFQPFTHIEPFRVEMDERLGLPRVRFFTDSAHWSAVVLADGALDYKL